MLNIALFLFIYRRKSHGAQRPSTRISGQMPTSRPGKRPAVMLRGRLCRPRPLRAGMSTEVSVDTGHPRGLPHFLTALF
jgi:hypothetical protein